ncbi:sigma-54-dependent transcriptional regulator [Acidobacteriota bacterium]
MISRSIYIVDDDQPIRDSLTQALEERYQVRSFETGEEALGVIKSDPPDLLLLDIGLPGMNGIDVLREVKTIHPQGAVVMITASNEVSLAVKAMKLGAYDFIVKPLQMENLEVAICNALEIIQLRKEVETLQDKCLLNNMPCFIGESDAMQGVLELITMVTKGPHTPVLIIGETGTGKDLIARAIHYRSASANGPLVTVNCAAIPRELIESELFGYNKGAFTGANTSGKKGLIEKAENGTLFLDEVGDLSLEAQSKLLRFLENGEFYRVGGTKTLQVQTRVVSATNKDIDRLIEEERFRKDLYYRLGVIRMKVPSLNERRADIIPLAEHFLAEFSINFGKEFTGISEETQAALKTRDWKGNVRELKNLIERGVLCNRRGVLELNDLGLEPNNGTIRKNGLPVDQGGFPPLPPEGVDLSKLQRSFLRYYLEQAYILAERNESKAARLLNMNHHTFRYQRKKLKIH